MIQNRNRLIIRNDFHPFCICILLFLLLNTPVFSQVITVRHPTVLPIPPGPVFRAGAAETDITPPPGFPLFGYSWDAADHARGYWVRLKSRAIVFESTKGKRVAMVQVDLGAMSGLLHREVAKRLAADGFNPGDLMIAASHTHAGPGGFFGYAFYNIYGSGQQGFYYQLVEWLANHIAKSVKEGCKDLAPARIAAGEIMVEGLSRNRSLDAWKMNFPGHSKLTPYNGIIPRINVIRVDHIIDDNPHSTYPIAVFVVAPVHASAVGIKNKLYHGDLFGTASFYVTDLIGKNSEYSRSVVAAVVSGPQGDVSSNWTRQGFDEARRLGHMLAIHVMGVFSDLKEKLHPVEVMNVYTEILVPRAETSHGPLCKRPMAGSPILGGTEDGNSFLYGKLGGWEGKRRKKPKGCHGYKRPAVGIFHNLLVRPNHVTSVAPLQVIQLGDEITLAMIPAEPTTETGRRICESIKAVVSTKYVSLIALANEYMSYVATREEYSAQHFEGAFTLYGPNEAQFFQENLVQLAKACGTNKIYGIPDKRTFSPGWSKWFFRKGKKPCNPRKWRGLSTFVKRNKNGLLKWVRFEWKGLKRRQYIKNLPSIKVLCRGCSRDYPNGIVDTDDGLNFIVQRKGRKHWSATWKPAEGIKVSGLLQISVSRPGMEPLLSEEFTVKKD